MKYAGQGATVRVAVAPPSKANPNRHGVTVSDDGPGIPREHIQRLTERFYRVNVATSRNSGGTGLGLAIVKHILNRHEGRLEIASTLGQGQRLHRLAAARRRRRRRPAGGRRRRRRGDDAPPSRAAADRRSA